MSNVMEYKCPCCGGAISFDSDSQQMKCPFCDSSFEMEILKAYDDELKNELPSDMSWDFDSSDQWDSSEQEGIMVYSCQSCGGDVISDSTTAATHCPYCDATMVMAGHLSGSLRPDYVIPFKLDKKAAKEALVKHLSKKRFLPKVFKTDNHIDEIKGVYVPYWLFDADADANIRYKATKLRTWSDSSYNYTETSFYSVAREGSLGFDMVPVDGSSKMADDLMESIEPYDYKGLTDFQTAYLAGYVADRYDVDAENSVVRANDRVTKSTEAAFAKTVVGYSSVTPEYSSIRLSNGKVKYGLLPVWILNTTWNNNKYVFAMNGQTGKFVGNLPLDKGAYWRWFFILTAILTAAIYGIQLLVGR